MRICFYNLTAGFKSGGLETYCWEVGRALARNGHEVTLIGGEGGRPRHAEVRLLALPYRPRDRFPNFGTRFRKLAERLSFARHALPHLLAGGFDAVVVNKPYDFPALWYARRRGLKAMTVLRSGGTDFWRGDRLFVSAIDHMVSTSAYNARQVRQRYGREVTVIHNGVDTDRFEPRRRAEGSRQAKGIPEDVVVVASVGRLIGLKGFRTVIAALADLPEAIHYLIVGDGPERPALEQQAAAAGVAQRVHFAGHVAHGDLPAWLELADLYAQPSVGEEAFGISVVEAMACGLPALVSDQGGLPEIVADDTVGRRLRPGVVGDWRAAIAEFAADPETRRAAGERARERVVGAFTWQANAEKLLQLIAEGVA